MASLYNKIHRLKMQPGWDWDRFVLELDTIDPDGISPKLLQNYYSSPHKKPKPHISELIDQLHSECFPSPFPEPLDRLMRVYRTLRSHMHYLNKEKDVADLEVHAKKLLSEVEQDDLLSLACLEWLLGHIEFDRISDALDSDELGKAELVKQRAVEHYRNVLDLLEKYNELHPEKPIEMRHRYRVHHNILTSHLNAVPDEQRMVDASVLSYLRQSDYLEQCKKAIEEEPFQWAIARSGLRFSSLIHDTAQVEWFFNKLVEIHPWFVDLSYEPYNQLSLSVLPEYQWAVQNVLTPKYLRAMKKQLKADAKEKSQAA